MQNITIAVDAMGGDFGPSVTVPAVMQALDSHPHLSIRLFGLKAQLEPYLLQFQLAHHPRLELILSSDVVLEEDKPLTALRHRRHSSMRLALEDVRHSRAQACVSAGNTGALMALSKLVLKLLPGIERPALVSTLPTKGGKNILLLDLGANASCDSDNLTQFAVMGAALAETVGQVTQPRVALLNIGEEHIKGNDVIRQAAQNLSNANDINYIGFIEGNQIFDGSADVIVCDGFVGNVALKTAEGVAKLLLERFKTALQTRPWLKWLLQALLPDLQKQIKSMNPDQYNGASLLGLRGIVIKSHGHADSHAFSQAITQAVNEVSQEIPLRIVDKLEALLTDKH